MFCHQLRSVTVGVAALHDMAATVAHLVTTKCFVRMVLPVTVIPVVVFPAMRHGSVIAMMRIVVIVDVPMKMGTAMEPGPCPKEDAAVKPLRAVIAPRSAVVRRIREISIGTYRCRPDPHADLRLGAGGGPEQQNQRKRGGREHG